MSQKTNLNISPYFDDFSENNNYKKVLFKPGFPIQARELTTLQSILQNQIERFGQHFFKDGSVVIPGGTFYDENYTSVKINPYFLNIPVKEYTKILSDNKIEIRGETSGVVATVVNRLTDSESEQGYDTLYIKYKNSGNNGTIRTFQDGENLITLSDINYSLENIPANSSFAQCIDTNSTEVGSSASINEGIYFIRGYFVKVDSSVLILDQYSNTPSYKIGLLISEEIISASQENQDLYDNALGFSNESAPGADRFKISTSLHKKLISDVNDENFVELLRVENGTLKKFIGNKTDYSIFKNELARRTYDESGDYYVKPFAIDVRESLNDRISNRGLYFENQLTQNGNTPSDDIFVLQVSPGKAYIRGFEIDKLSTSSIDVPKPRTTKSKNNISLPVELGSITKVDNVFGSPKIGFSTTYTVSLLDRRLADRQIGSATTIGLARVYDFNQKVISGVSTTQYELRLFDVQTYTNLTIGYGLTAPADAHVKGQYSGSVGFLKDSVSNGTSLIVYDTRGQFQINEPLIINGISVGRNISSIRDYDITDIKAVYNSVGVTTFASDLVLDRKKNLFSSSSQFTVSSGGTVTSPSISDFNSLVKIGDIVRYSIPGFSTSTYNRVVSVNANELNLESVTPILGVCEGGLPSTDQNVIDFDVVTNSLEKNGNFGYRIKLQDKYVSSINLLDANYIIRKQLTKNITGTTFTFYLSDLGDTNIFFEPFTENNYVLIWRTGERELIRDSQVTFNNDLNEMTISGLSKTGYATLTATVKRSSLSSKEKSLIRCSSIIVSNSKYQGSGIGSTTFNDGLSYNTVYGTRVQDEEISLNVSDVFRVLGIFESNDLSDPEVPSITVSSQTDSFVNNVIIGEQFIGNTSGALARVVRVVGSQQLEFVYENQKTFEIGESITLKTSGIVANISSLVIGDRNIIDNYSLDSGQRLEFVDYGRIIRKKSTAEPTRKLKVIFDYYLNNESSGTIETVNSYNALDYSKEIPFSINTRSSDLLDFRPRVGTYSTSSTQSPFSFSSRNFLNSSSETLVSKKTIILDYDYYLGRIDRLYLTKDGNFELKEGDPSENPKASTPNEEAFEVASIKMNPYVLNASVDCYVSTIPHKRYTMNDIGRLENRIKNLENYTTLSLLETDTKNLSIKDPNTGLDKFKSGFFVDNFRSHNYHNLTGESYFDIDLETGECRPRTTERNVGLIFETVSSSLNPINSDYRWIDDFGSSNITRKGSGLTLNYDEVEFISQPLATRVENLNPFLVIIYIGNIELNPSSDFWIEEVPLNTPDTIKIDSVYNAMSSLLGVENRENGGMAASYWNSHETTWTGRDKIGESVIGTEVRTLGTRVSTNVETDAWARTTTTTTSRDQRVTEDLLEVFEETGIDREFGLQLSSGVDTISLGNKIIGTDVLYNCRSRNIEVVGRRLKPNTKYYVFMENVDVTEYCVPKLIPVTMRRGAFSTSDIIQTSISPTVIGTPKIKFRAAQANHKFGPYNSPTETYSTEPYTLINLTSSYSGSSNIINVDTFDLSSFTNPDRIGWIRSGMILVNSQGTAEASVNSLELISDEKGNLLFSLHIPDPKIDSNPKFTTGLNTIRITSSQTNSNILGPGESSAEATYNASGLSQSTQEQVLSIKTPEVERIQVGSDQPITRIVQEQDRRVSDRTVTTSTSRIERFPPPPPVVNITNITNVNQNITNVNQNITNVNQNITNVNQNITNVTNVNRNITNVTRNIIQQRPQPPARVDPLAQSFLVQRQKQDGIFITGGDLYFKTKDDTYPVTVQIRTMQDGSPTNTVVPFGQTIIDPNDIVLSDDGSSATRFNFSTPVYLQSGYEYALVLLADTDKYLTFISRLGEEDLISGSINSRQPTLGSLFKSQNASTWDASQYEDLKFKLYKAKFVINTPSSVIFYNQELPFGNILKENPAVSYSKRQFISIASTTRFFEQGNTITQSINTANIFASGGPVGLGTTSLTLSFSGIGLTDGSYSGIGFTSLTGFGNSCTANITVSSGEIQEFDVTDGGVGYSVGDLLLSNQIGNTGTGVRATVGVVTQTNFIVVDDVISNINTGTGLTYYDSTGTSYDIPSPTSVNDDPIRDGYTILFDHRNHGMHSSTNKLEILNFASDISPTFLTEELTVDSTTLKVSNSGIFTSFEGVPIGPTNTGYLQIDNEIISYNSISNDIITITSRGIDSSIISNHNLNSLVYKYEFNSVSLRRINKEHNIDPREKTFDNYYININDGGRTFATTKSGGGKNLQISQNIPFEIIDPRVSAITPTGTTITARIKTTSGTSISGSELSFTDKGYENITLNKLNYLDDPRIVASKVNEYNLLNNQKSFALELTLNTDNEDVSPIVDLDTTNIILMSNLVDDKVSDYVTDSRVNIPGFDPNSAIYETKKINLEFPSNSLYVQFDGHRDAESDIKVFYKLYREDSSEYQQIYLPFNSDGSSDKEVQPNTLINNFSEYKYTAENLPQFNSFMIKVVMTSTNQAKPPRIKNLRTIALRSFLINE